MCRVTFLDACIYISIPHMHYSLSSKQSFPPCIMDMHCIGLPQLSSFHFPEHWSLLTRVSVQILCFSNTASHSRNRTCRENTCILACNNFSVCKHCHGKLWWEEWNEHPFGYLNFLFWCICVRNVTSGSSCLKTVECTNKAKKWLA